MNIHSFQAKNCSNKGSNPQPFFSILLQNSNDHNFFVSQRNLAILAATERGNDYLQLYGLNLRDIMILFGKSSFQSFNSRKSFAQEVKEGFHSSSPQ
ncbi:uncharacterized protein LOC130014524 isoform X3 [Mercurialis annua]|uniref:uncharacterized protein LOC130014526 isoform X3 n=1 Tax=Mercurialis annua TaxID=3986 RepID=UPI002160C2F3|nr:uncharacterized protein LOC130014526 isoform X3 [Mercurialis annua]XP_055959878.1 uncharacterized protein LOC130014590 isoform X3 [Mercurialis annua]XP_055959881.1 uncharacterized protein LOC130014524 isoform X3 [Mercurialis annua]